MSIKQGEYLKDLRVKNKYSQEKLGELLGLSRQSISKWEQGYAIPDTENLLKLSELYGVSVDTILKCGEEESKGNADEATAPATGEADEETTPKEARCGGEIHTPTSGESSAGAEQDNREAPAEAEKPPKKKRGWFFISYPVLAVIAYAIIGATFKTVGWATGWIVLLTIPLYYTGVIAFEKKKPIIFCYPVLTLIAFLIGGFFYSLWHPMWIIFLTIPLFYIIAAKAGKNK